MFIQISLYYCQDTECFRFQMNEVFSFLLIFPPLLLSSQVAGVFVGVDGFSGQERGERGRGGEKKPLIANFDLRER